MTSLEKIEGIGVEFAGKLRAAGIGSVEALLERGANPGGRRALEEQTGIRHNLLLEWVNHADLFRIKGVGEEYSDLLEEAGVDTVAELARRNPENLYRQMQEIDAKKKLVRRLPPLKVVEGWVEQAKKLPRAIEY